MSQTPEDYELFHYGVKGMKWGVRKDGGGVRGAISRRKARKEQEARNEKRNRSADRRELDKIKKKNVSALTNADLQKANKRMQLETEYARLMESTRTKGAIEKGWDFVMGANNQGNQAIGAYNGPTGKLLRAAGSKVINR